MRARLDDLPCYSADDYRIGADIFNQVRLASLRLPAPLRFPLPGLRNLEMVITPDCWVCVDSSLNDFPILAWVDFVAQRRDNLHEPIPCRMYTYHCHASLIVARVLSLMAQHLDECLHGEQST